MASVEHNIDEVMAQLQRNIQKAMEAAEEELQATALEIEAQAKVDAPVDTGILRASIATTGGGSEYEIGTNVEYAPFVEFGTQYQSAQPFLFPAFEAATEDLPERIKKAVAAEIKK